MRSRHSMGGVRRQRGRWIGTWYADGKRRSQVVGSVQDMAKSEAREEVAKIIAAECAQRDTKQFRAFVEEVYLPFYRRKWKLSTRGINENRVAVHLVSQFRDRKLDSFSRDELQDFLDSKGSRLSFSTVAHLRWDLKQIFDMAVAEGELQRNPAKLLFTPKFAAKARRRVMTIADVQKLFEALGPREQLIAKLAVLAGMRPGEIFALTWGRISDCAEIRQRVYRGVIDTPKTVQSERKAALSEGLLRDLEGWRKQAVSTTDEAWVFPSENMTPLGRENVWRRSMAPMLKKVDLGWVNFQVMRRTHSTLMNAIGVEGKLVADQLGHTLDVNQNVYTQSPVALRQEAVNRLENALSG
jgi:integrase